MTNVKGYIGRILFRNENNFYTVFSLEMEEGNLTLTGNFKHINQGEYIEACGMMKLHPKYGEQLLVNSYKIIAPKTTKAIEKYLSSGAFKGVGEKLAKRIVDTFKENTIEILEKEPEKLSQIKGISINLANSISEQIVERKDISEAMFFLQKYGISLSLASKIYKTYKEDLYTIISENPYKLADDISGVGFKIADEIAQKVGIKKDCEFRIKSAFSYVMQTAALSGHIYIPLEEALKNVAELLALDMADVSEYVLEMQVEKRIVLKKMSDFTAVYTYNNYYMELSVAKMLHDIDIRSEENYQKVLNSVNKVESEIGIELDVLQKKAVIEAVYSGLLIITGGPGTGKTTVINTIIRYFEDKNLKVALAAPTGRAAKRMSEASLHEAKTIHRLLEINGPLNEDEEEKNKYENLFERNENNPLEEDVIIVDELSMVDLNLMYFLLKAIPVGTRLILVGDINQLPSVGAGNILKDIIYSDCFNVVILNKIYRQALSSDIVVNAHKMIDEEFINLDKKSEDFFFIEREDSEKIIATILNLLREKLPNYLKCKKTDIQILTPMRKGNLGVERLNIILQDYLNPLDNTKKERIFKDKTLNNIRFRQGDKIMQTKNNYQLEWKIKNEFGNEISSGLGVYNGDIGCIEEIDDEREILIVKFDDNKIVEYNFNNVNELELAYAITIHKAQGSEYPAIIMPIFFGARLLMSRNLIYTAITRARKMVLLVGSKDAFYNMVNNTLELKRYSSLDDKIKDLAQ